MKHRRIYIFSVVSLLTILNLIIADKDSNDDALFLQNHQKGNDSLAESKMEELTVFRRKLLKVTSKNTSGDIQNSDDDYICKTKERGDEVMNDDCKNNDSNSENSFQVSKNNTIENLLQFRKNYCKPKKLQKKRAIDSSGRKRDTQNQADCKDQEKTSDYQDNNDYDMNNDDIEVDQDTDYDDEEQANDNQDDEGNYDVDGNAVDNYDDNNNKAGKKSRRSDNNNRDTGLGEGYEYNNQDDANILFKDGNKNNNNNYGYAGNYQENNEGNNYGNYQDNNEGNENYQNYNQGNEYGNYQDNNEGNENEDYLGIEDPNNENNDNYVYEQQGDGEDGYFLKESKETDPDDIDSPPTTRKPRRRTRFPPDDDRFPPKGTKNPSPRRTRTPPDDDKFPPKATKNPSPRRTRFPRPGTRFPNIHPRHTTSRTLGTDIPGGLGKYFVYVNCTTCKIKSQLVVLSKKGSSQRGPKTTERYPGYP